jgi:hypothetical protein
MKYFISALNHNIIQELHIWNLSTDETTHQRLHPLDNLPKRVIVYSDYPLFFQEKDYFEFYTEYSKHHSNDIIIKCDDNIVFIDIFKLPYFIHLIHHNQNARLLLPNTVMDDSVYSFQQTWWNIFPESLINATDFIDSVAADELLPVGDDMTRSKFNSCFYFLKNWKELIRPLLVPLLSYLSPSTLLSPLRRTNDSSALQEFFKERKFNVPVGTTVERTDPVYYLPEVLQVSYNSAPSPSFFGVKASHWISLTSPDRFMSLSSKSESSSYLVATNFFVSKLPNFQVSTSLSSHILPLLTDLFSELSESYLQQPLNDRF